MEASPSLISIIFNQTDRPRWLVIMNRLSLAGLIAAPLIFFGSIFIFDHPENLLFAVLMFLIVNSYSFFILLLSYLSYKVYPASKWLAALFPFIAICGYVLLAIQVIQG